MFSNFDAVTRLIRKSMTSCIKHEQNCGNRCQCYLSKDGLRAWYVNGSDFALFFDGALFYRDVRFVRPYIKHGTIATIWGEKPNG
jgi:hypothetical protein